MVVAGSSPVSGILDLGAYPPGAPAGHDGDQADEIAEALVASTFVSVVRPDIMRWKYPSC